MNVLIIDVMSVRKEIKKKLKTRFYPKNKKKTFVDVIKTLPSLLLAFGVEPID